MNNKISSLSQLINRLQSATKSEYKSIGVVLDIPLEEFLPYAHWSKERYTRNGIIRTEKFELILLCWESGQSTPVHCHGGEECWVYLGEGKIEESQFDLISDMLVEVNKEVLSSGEKSFMSDEMGYHSLRNLSPLRTMSLHLYMDPIDDCTVFDNKSNEFIPRSLSYHSYNGVLEVDTVEL